MADSLAQLLVDAAAEASWIGPPEWHAQVVQSISAPIHREMARRSVVAVLDTLRTGASTDMQTQLRRLAVEVRALPCP